MSYAGSVPDTEPAADWRKSAACRQEDPDLFFPTGTTGPSALIIEQAKAICHRCPVVDRCLEWAVETGQEAGVWGGLSEDERRLYRHGGQFRDLTAEAMANPRPAREQGTGRSFPTLRDENTVPVDGEHVRWVGKRCTSIAGRSWTFRQIAFTADRGHPPEGRVVTECGFPGCVHPRHISDEQERDERALDRLAAAAESPAAPELDAVPDPMPDAEPTVAVFPVFDGCGTPAGARAHEACDEELCDACWSAIAHAVGRLNTERVPA